MRWSYLIPRAVLLLIFWAFFAFAFDPLLQRATITAGQEAVGARVEMSELTTSFFPPALEMRDTRIANRFSPGKNLLEFDELRFELEGRPLLKRKFIGQGHVSGLKWSTQRGDSGSVDGGIFKGLSRLLQLDGLGSQAADLGKQGLKQLMEHLGDGLDPRQLETVRVADELHQQWTGRFEDYERRVGLLERGAKDIERSIRNVDGNALNKLESYSRAAAEVERLLAEAQRIRTELTQLPAAARSDFRRLDTARTNDQRMIGERLQLLSLDPEALSEALLGRELAHRLEQNIAWMRVVRQQVEFAVNPPEPERLRGEDVDFATGEELPQLLVRTLTLSGEAELNGEMLPFEGTVSGLSSDPKLYGQPVIVQANLQGAVAMELDAMFDHTQQQPVQQFGMTYSLPRQVTTHLGDPEGVALTVEAQSLTTVAFLQIEGEKLSGELTLTQEPVVLRLAGAGGLSPDLQRMLNSALQDVDRLDAAVSLSGSVEEPKLRLRSNLGPEMAASMDRVLKAEMEAQRQKLLAQLDAAAQKRTAELRQLMQVRYRDVLSQLDLNENQAQLLIQRFAGRPIDLPKLFRR